MGVPTINPAEFVTWVLVLVRLSMLVFLAPIFSSPLIATEIKIMLCLVLTFMIAPFINMPAEALSMEWPRLTFMLFSEIFLGLCLAFMVKLVLEAANVAGEYIGFQMGFSIVNVVDPQTGGQVSIVSQMVYLIATLVFLYANGHLLVFKALRQSFTLVPPGSIDIWSPYIFTEIIKALTNMYILAVKIAAPVLAVLFCVKVAFGIIAKAVPQMNVLFVGMPLYIIVGLVMLVLSLPFWPELLGKALLETELALDNILILFQGVSS